MSDRKMAIILSKSALDSVYPALILANAARMSDIDALIFFTFWGLDVVTEKKVDALHISLMGNPSVPVPTMLAGLPGMEAMASSMMRKKIDELDLPEVREMLEILDDSGCELYACELAMQMMQLKDKDLLPQIKGVITATDFYDMSHGAQVLFI